MLTVVVLILVRHFLTDFEILVHANLFLNGCISNFEGVRAGDLLVEVVSPGFRPTATVGFGLHQSGLPLVKSEVAVELFWCLWCTIVTFLETNDL